MNKHRNPQASLSKQAPPDNFNPGLAIERLYRELVEVESLAIAADEAVTSTVRAMAETTTPTTRRRPPHGHASTSVANIRCNSSATGPRLPRGALHGGGAPDQGRRHLVHERGHEAHYLLDLLERRRGGRQLSNRQRPGRPGQR